ncbi:MAG: hypothetical protein LBJ24_02620 [Treponema sp.]|jgi:hypothetical protein|nr:hypothetical protein [Treponema sp.]
MKRWWIKSIFLFLCCFCSGIGAWALDFGIHGRGFTSIPLGGDSAELYTPGGGADLQMDIDFASILTNPFFLGYSLGPELGYNAVPLIGSGTVMHLFSAGLGAGLFYYPFSRLNLRLTGSAGFFGALYNDSFYPTTWGTNIWWKAGGEAGYRFSPSFILSLNGGYRTYNYKSGDPLYAGIYAGLTVQYILETGKSSDNIIFELIQDEPVFPIFMGLYRQNRFGVLRLTNNESAEIRNITVSFRAGNYTASQYLCGTLPALGKRRSAYIPLFADFSDQILNFAENGRIPGEVEIRYELLGSTRTTVHTVVVLVFNRNSYRWIDTTSLGVFISAASPEVLDYSKYVVGLARNNLRTGLNRQMQFAIYLFEGLRGGGVRLLADGETPYTSTHLDISRVDSIQFPFQTLAYRSGDMDDLGLLYAAALESAGIRAALIPLDDDFLVAYSLDIGAAAAGNIFNSMDNLLLVDDEVWMVVALSSFNEGFVNSWYQGMNRINAAVAEGRMVDMIRLQDAWGIYPPAAVGGRSGEFQYEKPPELEVSRSAETNMMRYIAAEFSPKIQAVFDEIRALGGTAARYNQLGLLYVRSGMYAEARAEYQRAAALGSAPAMVNLGNLALMEQDFAAADNWYGRALAVDPDNQAALRGMEQIALERNE